MKNILCIAAIAALTTVGSMGDVLIRTAGKDGVRWKLLGLGMCCYFMTVPGWFFLFRYVKFPVIGTVSAVVSILLFTWVGIFWFKDTVRPVEWVGIGMAVGSLVLLSRFS